MLNVKRLRVLSEVAARGSFSAAAAALSYTQSAVSQQIAVLERETGVQLVERGPRGVRLTEPGRALVSHARAVLGRLAEAEAELEALAGLRAGRLRLASFSSAGATLIPVAVAEFRRRHPAVELTLSPAEPEDAVAGVRAGEYDVALGIDGDAFPLEGADLERLELLDDPLSVALPAAHPLAEHARISLADLAAEPWLLCSTTQACPDGRIMLGACRSAGFEPRIVFASDDYWAIQGFIAAGMGVSMIPELALSRTRDDVVIRPVAGVAPVRRIFAVALAAGYRSPAASAILAVLGEVSANWGSDGVALVAAG